MGAYEVSIGPKPVSTKGSTTSAMTIPLTKKLDGRRVKSVRMHYHLEANSGNCTVRVVLQTSDDGCTWSASSALTGYAGFFSAAGWSRGTAFASVTQAPFVRFLVEAKNTSGTDMECVRLKVVLEIRFA